MPTNPRPPRKKTNRPVTRRIAGRPRPGSSDPVDPATPTTESSAESVEDNSTSTPDASAAAGRVAPSERSESDADRDHSAATDDTTPDTTPDKPAPTGKTRPVSRVSTLRPGDSSTASTRAGSAAPEKKKKSRPASDRRRTVGILAAVAAVLAVFAVIAGLHPGASIGANKAFVDQAATTELTSQVQSKACNLTVDTVDVNKWADKARSVLTGTALSDFDKYLPQQREILNQTKQVADCRVESVGVADLSGADDGATARVVVNMIVSQQQAGVAGQSAAPRYQFGMVRHGDDWLISEVEAF